jgi:hypothetical protein
MHDGGHVATLADLTPHVPTTKYHLVSKGSRMGQFGSDDGV